MAISLDELLEANRRYASGFTQGSLAMPPARKLAIVACMDARVEPLAALGLNLGDTHVIRNAGGRVSQDALRSLAISERLLGTEAILVIHHTDCGMLTFSNADIRAVIKNDLGDEAASEAEDLDFLPFSDLAASVRADVATIKTSPLIPNDIPVYGLIYDVRSGALETVA